MLKVSGKMNNWEALIKWFDIVKNNDGVILLFSLPRKKIQRGL